MKLFIKNENNELVSFPRFEMPNLKTGEIFIESNCSHEGEHINCIREKLEEQKSNYMDMVFNAHEDLNKQSLFYYVNDVKVFTEFNGRKLFI